MATKITPLIPLLFIIMFSLVLTSHQTGGADSDDPLNIEEKKALLSFISNVNQSASYNWNLSQPACSWDGVTCDPSDLTVLYLILPGTNLIGEIPDNTLGNLTNLRVLSLGYNHLSGAIPSDFSNLSSLTTLYLNDNNFSGDIPSFFKTNFPYLIRLVLNHNSFTGSLPDMTNAQDLTTFNVSYNNLVGRIPRSLSKFPLSAFSSNVYLCGPPLPQCNTSYPPPTSEIELDNNESVGNRAIFGVYSGSVLLSMIVLGSLGKKMYQKMKQPQSKATEIERKKHIVTFFDKDDGIDFDELLTTTAQVLGVGRTYKQVVVGKNKTVVVKILKNVAVTEDELKRRMEDLGNIIENKYLVPLRGFCNYSSHETLLVYDYMPAGSLFARLHGSDETQLDWGHRMRIALSAAKGLTYLHVVKEIVHGNITSSNIFLQQDNNDEVSLSDYGLNPLFYGSSSLNCKATGYWAPEVLETQEFTFVSDVYSFGVLLLELLTRKIPNHASLDKAGVHFSEWVGSIVCKEPNDELFDVELKRGDNINTLVQMLQIAKDCVLIVPNQRPLMWNVVSMMEDMLNRRITT